MLMQINKLAVETCYWPLYEVVDGKYKITYKPAKKLPIEEFLKPQKDLNICLNLGMNGC